MKTEKIKSSEAFPKEMICIVCPMGCQLTVSKEQDGLTVTGNKCPRGKVYAIEEQTHPSRVLPTTVSIAHGLHARLPVKTAQPIPKSLIESAMAEISKIEVEAPVESGDIVIENLLGTGIAVVASRGMSRV